MSEQAATFDVDLSVPPETLKRAGVFWPPARRARIAANTKQSTWARELVRQRLADARPWLAMSDTQLRQLVVAPTLKRSWMVWSTGWCPGCRTPVPMYTWRIEAVTVPWQVTCPHCAARFPTNDFEAYYCSGLDAKGWFRHELADRALLFNVDHPEPTDPLHGFGVDDGRGYRSEDHTWWFVGAYLIYGQWKQLVVGGVHRLAVAHLVSGEVAYAHKAAVLLDRIADLYPEFDFASQGIMHDHPADGCNGYVSTWHDACGETRALALAYDLIFDAAADDETLVASLGRRFTDIQRHIESRIFRDAFANRQKIMCNYPHTDFTVAVLIAVLDWPRNRAAVHALLDWIIRHSTGFDGTTGEKGMTDYAAFTCAGLAQLLALFDQLDTEYLPNAFARFPALSKSFRFHFDTWCLGAYYPQIGDSGAVGMQQRQPVGLVLSKDQGAVPTSSTSFVTELGLTPSMFSFLRRLYVLTGDDVYLARLSAASDDPAGLPFDLLAEDPAAVVADVTAYRQGPRYRQQSCNFDEWHLALLRSGADSHERVAWLHYDSGGFWHGHTDGMNLGLFAHGLDLMPDFGYPPLQFAGGYEAPEANWYGMAAAHNTVVVDGLQKVRYAVPPATGTGTLWGTCDWLRVIRAAGAEMIEDVGGERYERTIVMVDISPEHFYLLDVFQVVGGSDHAKFQHASFGKLATAGLRLTPTEPYGYGTLMRSFLGDAAAPPGWTATWQIDDHYGYLPAPAEVHVRYTDLTAGAAAATCEGWVNPGGLKTTEEAWIPRLMIRRRGPAPLQSTFVAVIEAYAGAPGVMHVERVPLLHAGTPCADAAVAIAVEHHAGRDLIVLPDDCAEEVRQPAAGLTMTGKLCALRLNAAGDPLRLAAADATALALGTRRIACTPGTGLSDHLLSP